MERNDAVRITLLLDQYRRQDPSAFSIQPTDASFRDTNDNALIAVYRVKRQDGYVLHVLFGELYEDQNYYCVLYPQDRSSPIAHMHQIVHLPTGAALTWQYQPRKRDNRNAERRRHFERLMGELEVHIQLPSTLNEVERFLTQLCELAENRHEADDLAPRIRETAPTHRPAKTRSHVQIAPNPPRRRPVVRPVIPESVPISRLVIQGESSVAPWMAEAMLLHILDSEWPDGMRAEFLLTPGGFVGGNLPARWSGGMGSNSTQQGFLGLVAEAEQLLAQTVTERVREAARTKVDALTIGISLAQSGRPERAELVAFYDLNGDSVHWTGNSYPTKQQERDLFQVIDFESHMINFAEHKVLLLGSYDIDVYKPRTSPTGLRKLLRADLSQRFDQFEPTIVLHHPLLTDTPRLWLPSWTELEKKLPSATTWASGICYPSGTKRPRGRLRDVLVRTAGGKRPYDFIVVSSGDWAEAR